MGLYLTGPKAGHLLGKGSQLGCPTLGSGKLHYHLPTQPHLLNEVILGVLLLMQEPRLLLAASHKRL